MGNSIAPDMTASEQTFPGSTDVFIIWFSPEMHAITIFFYCQSSANSTLFLESNQVVLLGNNIFTEFKPKSKTLNEKQVKRNP